MNPRPETLSHLRNRIDLASTGEEMLALMGALNPICRSISGDGLRQSLGQLAAFLPLTTHEVATGTRAFDWIVPKEWNIRDAYIKDSAGRRVIDFQKNNLHDRISSCGRAKGAQEDEDLPHLRQTASGGLSPWLFLFQRMSE